MSASSAEAPTARPARLRRDIAMLAMAVAAAFVAGILGTSGLLSIYRVPTAGPAAKPVATPTSAARSPSPSPSPPALALRGTIAISRGTSGSGGWIVFPGGEFTADPATDIPVLNGLTYDRAAGRWVPVSREAVRPDGLVYAFVDENYNLAASPADGTSRSVLAPHATAGSAPYTVLSAEPDAVYAEQGTLLVGVDYWGSRWEIKRGWHWLNVSNGFAYAIAWGDPINLTSRGAVIARFNLRTGAGGDWFSRSGLLSEIRGFAADGTPIVFASNVHRTEIWLAGATPKLLYSAVGDPGQPLPQIESALGDSTGIWVAMSSGLYLYTDQNGWQRVSAVTGQLASGFRSTS